MDEITGRDLNDDDLRMEAELVATQNSLDDEPDSEAAPQSADSEGDASKDEVQGSDESEKDESKKDAGNDEAGGEKVETEIV